jgi:dipeptidase D
MPDKETERVIEIMDEINRIPRQSHHLELIHPWLMEWGRSRGFETETDEALNVLIKVPGTPGFENAPTVILQGHMDMVCEKRPDVEHDFQKDPIISCRDGEWLRAEGTSLGADNAIALALAFDLVTDPDAEYPPLEILITSDEETGLVGAQKLQPGFLKGSVLINLDSEDEGVFTIGCAGGLDTNLFLPVNREALPGGYEFRRLFIRGLEGGHSGIEINAGKANANVLLVRALRELSDAVPDLRIGELEGGTAHNAIPREARALLALPAGEIGGLEKALGDFNRVVKAEIEAVEKNFRADLEAVEADEAGAVSEAGLFSPSDAGRLIDALRLIPHGVKAMSPELEGVVDTSMNFAVLKTEKEQVKVLTNRRSAVMSRGADFSEIMFALARLYGGSYETGNHYPPWELRSSSDVLDRGKRIWKELFGEDAEVEVTHAGLECGAIGSRFPGLDMISFGPTILQPHSPDERMNIPSVGRVRSLFRELLKSYRG